MNQPLRSSFHVSPLRLFLPIASVFLVGSSPGSAAAQQASIDPSHAPADDPQGAPTVDEGAFRFDGRGVYAGAGPGLVPEIGEAGLATRVQLVFPVAVDWFAIEAGLLGQSFSVTDHHGERVDSNVGAITTGARFSFPSDSTVRPYGAVRLAHLHFFPDPFGEHGHDAGGADHESHHRWGAGGALGLEAGIPEATSRFRLAIEAEALTVTGPGVSVMGQVVALFGIGF